MRITRQRLQEMIEDGVTDMLSSVPPRRILEAADQEDGGVTFEDLINFGEAYVALGRGSRDALRRLAEGHTPDQVTLRSLETELSDGESRLSEVALRRITEARRRTRR